MAAEPRGAAGGGAATVDTALITLFSNQFPGIGKPRIIQLFQEVVEQVGEGAVGALNGPKSTREFTYRIKIGEWKKEGDLSLDDLKTRLVELAQESLGLAPLGSFKANLERTKLAEAVKMMKILREHLPASEIESLEALIVPEEKQKACAHKMADYVNRATGSEAGFRIVERHNATTQSTFNAEDQSGKLNAPLRLMELLDAHLKRSPEGHAAYRA